MIQFSKFILRTLFLFIVIKMIPCCNYNMTNQRIYLFKNLNESNVYKYNKVLILFLAYSSSDNILSDLVYEDKEINNVLSDQSTIVLILRPETSDSLEKALINRFGVTQFPSYLLSDKDFIYNGGVHVQKSTNYLKIKEELIFVLRNEKLHFLSNEFEQ